jgi:EmrB/QacA subfamily drug resistance transporter
MFTRHFTPESIHERRWWILAALCTSLVVIAIDNTVLNVALPTIQNDLNASNIDLQWIVDGYILVFAAMLLTMGTLGDRFGRNRLLVGGLVVFGTFSLLSGFTQTPGQLITMRVIQGLGGAAIMPSTLSILMNVFDDEVERERAIGIWAAVTGAGVALGPVVGGGLIGVFNTWKPVFWINVPIVLVALILGAFLIPPSKDPNAPKLDVVGGLLSTAGLFGVVFGIIQSSTASAGWTDPIVIGPLLGGLVTLVVFTFWERHSDHPMLEVMLFKNMRFTAASVAIGLIFFSLMGGMYVFTQYLQYVQDFSPLEAGLRTLPLSLAIMIFALVSARVDMRIGSKMTVAVGLATMVVGFMMNSFFEVDTAYWYVAISIGLIGTAIGMAMTPATNSIMGALPPEKAGVGSATNDATRQVGGTLGVAVLGAILSKEYATKLDGSLDTLPSEVQDRIAPFRVTLETSVDAAVKLSEKARADGAPAEYVNDVIGFAKQAFVEGQSFAYMFAAGSAFIGLIITAIWLPARSSGASTIAQQQAPADAAKPSQPGATPSA